jgi:hypothetical protein
MGTAKKRGLTEARARRAVSLYIVERHLLGRLSAQQSGTVGATETTKAGR